MKLCPTCEPEYSCCDFCRHYNFNGGGEDGQIYNWEGFCKLTNEQKDPGDFICDKFHCFRFMEENHDKDFGD